MKTTEQIAKVCDSVKELLIRKNADYGDSWREPGALSPLSAGDKLLIRIDDKLARMRNLIASGGDAARKVQDETVAQTVDDLIGYFILYKIWLSEKVANNG